MNLAHVIAFVVLEPLLARLKSDVDAPLEQVA